VNTGDVVTAAVIVGIIFLLACLMAFIAATPPRWRTGGRSSSPAVDTPSDRAEDLLRDMLDEQELLELRTRGYLDIVSPSHAQRVYRIPRFPERVSVLEGGRAKWELCIQPAKPIPSADVVAMHKLMIEGDEEEYLARANWFLPYVPHQWDLP